MNVDAIRTALAGIAGRDFSEAANDLLDKLGYSSKRTLPGQSGRVPDFIRQLPAGNPGTASERLFVQQAESVRLLFQVTDREIPRSVQSALFESSGLNASNTQSFLFVAVELRGEGYARGEYASFAREVNKRLNAPTVVLFRTPTNLLTLAFVHRRPSLRDEGREVLGKVSLIREIKLDDPHRAHLDILSELSLYERRRWMDRRGRPQNFDGLLAAWLDALDTEELNRRFYRDLFAWFERAVETAKFPTKERVTLSSEEHVMRLITRLMFVWFVKEKGLVAEDLFIENQVRDLLRDYDAEGGDSYYRTVLQNLFFATLNTKISDRRFSKGRREDHRNFSLYRYESEMVDSKALRGLFDKTPFINGGLFDCLDTFNATGSKGYRVDCFSDKRTQRRGYSIPNALFFDEDDKAPGVIRLFERYKFTVEENTPAEQEVALDPELLGKVFENLLAAYNPETRETARKQTGSYYTPREVVDYMVDEALVAALAQKAPAPSGDAKAWEETLRRLLDYGDGGEDQEDWGGLTDAKRQLLVEAIADLKVLDPAVGSGAFPMAVLHKLTLALGRLDRHNNRWEQLQRQHAGRRSEAAFGTDDQQQRDEELKEISATFERYRDSDFGRKLYLIQNSIYGVDIQPVATQIAKLRFFISLAIDQEPDESENYGIKPLPNLETRFVVANTLLGLDRPLQAFLPTRTITRLRQELDNNRERHFHANTRQHKMACRREDARLRHELADALREADFPAEDANKIALWDPYDQNASAGWFDPEYMFGVDGGFDVVIGNPPYVVTSDKRLREIYKDGVFGRMNTYGLFIQRGLQLAGEEGQLTYINPRTLLTDRYFTNLRKVIRQNAELTGVVMIADRHNTFESVLQECIIPHLTKKLSVPESYTVGIRNIVRPGDLLSTHRRVSIASKRVLLGDDHDGAFLVGSSGFEYDVFERMKAAGRPLDAYGLKAVTGRIQFDKYRKYALPKRSANACRLIWAENVQRYANRKSLKRVGKEWLNAAITTVIAPNITSTGIVTQRITANEQPRRIIATLTSADALSANRVYSENHTNFIALDNTDHSLFFLAALNSSLMEFAFRKLNSNTQVSAGELNALPFPPMSREATVREIEECASEILKKGGVDGERNAIQRIIGLELRIDDLIGSLYGFTEDEVFDVQQLLPDYTAIYGVTDEGEDAALGRAIDAALAEDPDGYVSEETIMATLRDLDAD